MAQCPSCSQNVAITEDHFGTLYRCEHCRTEFFVGFDGVPENSKQAAPEEKDIKSENISSIIDVVPPVKMTIDMNATSTEAGGDSGGLFNIPDVPQDQPTIMPMNLSVEEPATPEVEVKPHVPSNAFKNFTQDVEQFGNDVSLSGVLSFDIEISGIDIADIRAQLIEALNDKRFGWDLDEISQSIKDGKLRLENISAPKIIVLVKRITPMGLSLNWRHNVSTQ